MCVRVGVRACGCTRAAGSPPANMAERQRPLSSKEAHEALVAEVENVIDDVEGQCRYCWWWWCLCVVAFDVVFFFFLSILICRLLFSVLSSWATCDVVATLCVCVLDAM